MNYTKGPWKITLHMPKATLEKDCISGVEFTIANIEFHRGEGINKANAQLIASAPELLEACKLLTSELVNGQNVPSLSCMEKIRQAIAKAEGK